MKKTKVIIPALGILLLSTAASVTGTVAWFSSNASVSATGMSVRAHTDEALVIGLSHTVGSAVTVSLTDKNDNVSLIPVTYKAAGAVSEGSALGYYYCTSGPSIDPSTGFGLNGAAVELAKAPYANNGLAVNNEERVDYYKEFVVYLAAAGQQIDNAKLKATVDFGTPTLTQKAATIDFTVLGATTGADVNPSTQAISHDLTVNAAMDSYQIQLSNSTTFPLNTLGDSIPVLMRLYVDGALADDAGKAYVRSEEVNLNDLAISVTFSLN